MYRPYSRSTEADFIEYSAKDGSSESVPMWSELFASPSLQQLIDSALTRNTDLQMASLRIAESEAALRSARLGYLPSFKVSASASTNGGFEDIVTSLTGNASWQLDVFGSITNAKRKARAVLLESEAYRDAVQTQLVADVAASYYTLALLRSQRAVTAETAEAWAQTIDVTKAMKEAGMVNEAAIAQYEGTYWSVKASLDDYDYSIRKTENALRSLLVLSPSDDEQTLFRTDESEKDLSVDLTGIARSFGAADIANRPDVIRAEAQLMQAYYVTGIARAALWPTITITGEGVTDFNFESFGNHLAASLLQPVFNAGSLRAKLRISEAQQQEALLAYEQAFCDAAIEVDDALASLRAARAKTESCDRQVEALERAADATDALMQYGTASTTYLDVLTARRSLLTARLARLSNATDEVLSIITLYRALGGGVH